MERTAGLPFTLLLSLAGPAFAKTPAPIEGPATPWERMERHLDAESQGRRGWYLEGGTAAGGCTGDLCADVLGAGPGLGLAFGFGYRFAPLFALGLSLQIQSLGADAGGVGCAGSEGAGEEPCHVDDAEAGYGALGVTGRFHLTRRGPFDPWAGFFAGPVRAYADADRRRTRPDSSASRETLEGELSGAAIGLEIGAAYALVTRLSLTLSARYLFVAWTEACFDAGGTSSCASGDSMHAETPVTALSTRDLPDLWSVTLGIRGML